MLLASFLAGDARGRLRVATGIPCAKRSAGARRRRRRPPRRRSAHDHPAGHHPRASSRDSPSSCPSPAPGTCSSSPGCSTGTSCSRTPTSTRRSTSPCTWARSSPSSPTSGATSCACSAPGCAASPGAALRRARRASWPGCSSSAPSPRRSSASPSRTSSPTRLGKPWMIAVADDRLRPASCGSSTTSPSSTATSTPHLDRRARSSASPRRWPSRPGVSRSGITMMTGLLLRLDRESAARYSFLMSIPVIGGAAVYKGLEVAQDGLPAGHRDAVRRRHGLGRAQRLRRHLVPARLPQAAQLQPLRGLPHRGRRRRALLDRRRACASGDRHLSGPSCRIGAHTPAASDQESPVRDLSRGDRGKEVLDVQTRLRGQGFELGREGVDGFFGPQHRARRALVPAGARPARRRRASAPTPGASWSRPATRSATACSTCASRRSAATTCSPSRSSSTCSASTPAPSAASTTRTSSAPCSTSSATPACRSTASSARARSSSSRPLRKAESGREGKKIPERDGGYVAARSLTGQIVVVDPGHGGADTGVVSPRRPRREGLHAGARPAAGRAAARRGLPRARSRARRDEARAAVRARRGRRRRRRRLLRLAALQRRTSAGGAAAPPATTSSAATTTPSTAAGWPTTSARASEAAGAPCLGSFGRNYGVLREPRGDRRPGRAALPHQPRRGGAGAAAGPRRDAGAGARRRPRRLPGARALDEAAP